jgi:putative ABC transport system permease protein
MTGRVPLARRYLLADPRRLAASAVGVGLAVMLILLLDGLWTGIRQGVTAYEDNVGADLYVAQQGTHNFYGSSSRIPIGTLDVVRATPDVDWATAVRSFYAIVDLHGKKVAIAVIGSVPGERGGPWHLGSGRAPRVDDEIVVGRVLARRHGLHVGDRLDVMGREVTIVGTGADAFMTSYVFMTHAATDVLLEARDSTSFVLVGTRQPTAVRSRLEELGFAVLDRAELGRNDFDLIARAFSVPMRVMTGVAFVIGSVVIALTAYSAIADRRREYGIVKAMGGHGRFLLTLALRQTMLIAIVGLATGAVLFVAGRVVITNARPQFAVIADGGSFGRAAAAAVVMGAVAAVIPARRLAKLDPSTAYRGG